MYSNLPSCDSIADYFLLHLQQECGDTMSNLKLQKLCYYAQAWHLALFGKPLFKERIEAWAHGPVIPSLYFRFRQCGMRDIPQSMLKTLPSYDLHKEHLELLENVWEKYGGLSGTQLEALTHNELPWKKAYGNLKPGSKCEVEITHGAMRDYYKGLLTA